MWELIKKISYSFSVGDQVDHEASNKNTDRKGRQVLFFSVCGGGAGGRDNKYTLSMLSSSIWGASKWGYPVGNILGRLGQMMRSNFHCQGFLLIYPFKELEKQTKDYIFSHIKNFFSRGA